MNLSKRLISSTLIVAVVGAAALPAISEAATAPASNPTQTSTYTITVNKGVLAGGGNQIKAKVVVTDPQSNVSDWYSKATVQKVVRKAANQGIQKPFTYEGYRCVPKLDGSMNASTAHFTCKLTGGDVPTTVKLTFTIPFKPATA
jgi:hypothetical protein